MIRQLWSGDWVDFDGRYYQARGARLYDVPSTAMPIYIAASGTRSARIAGAHGDGWITDQLTIQRGDGQKQAYADAARAAGKKPDEMPKIVELWAVVGDRDEAIAAARPWQLILAFNEAVDLAGPREVQRLAEARVSPEQVADTWVVSKEPDVHIAAVRELAAAGATHVFLHSPQPDQRAAIEFYGKYVLPKLA